MYILQCITIHTQGDSDTSELQHLFTIILGNYAIEWGNYALLHNFDQKSTQRYEKQSNNQQNRGIIIAFKTNCVNIYGSDLFESSCTTTTTASTAANSIFVVVFNCVKITTTNKGTITSGSISYKLV